MESRERRRPPKGWVGLGERDKGRHGWRARVRGCPCPFSPYHPDGGVDGQCHQQCTRERARASEVVFIRVKSSMIMRGVGAFGASSYQHNSQEKETRTRHQTTPRRKGKGDERASPSCSNGKERKKKTRTHRCGVDDVLRFGSIVILFDRHTHHTRCMSLGVLREHCAPRALCLALRPPFRPPNPPNDLLTRPIHPIDRSVAPDRALNRSHTRSNRTQGPVNVLRSSVNAIRAADGEPPPAAATSSPPRAPIHMAGRDASSCDPRSRTSGPSVRSPSQPPRLASSVLGRVGRTDGCCGGVHPSTG